MRVAVNGWRLCSRRTGIARYLLNLLQNWTPDVVPPDIQIDLHLPADIPDLLPRTITKCIHPSDRRMLVWDNLHVGLSARGDVLLCASHSRPLVTRMPTVVVMHDIVFARHPEFYPPGQRWFYNPLYRWSARNAATVITDSQHGKDDICSLYGVSGDRVRVVYMAGDSKFGPIDHSGASGRQREILGDNAPFFLFVGKMTGRRNVPELIRGFAQFKKSGPWPHRLCLAGPKPQHFNLDSMVHELDIDDSCVALGFVSDEDLNALYNTAEATVMPAVHETVSLPVMESQRAGCPVICLGTKGMREIAADGALYLERMDPGQIARALTQMADSPQLRTTLAAKSILSSNRFSWRKTAEEVLQVLIETAR